MELTLCNDSVYTHLRSVDVITIIAVLLCSRQNAQHKWIEG